MRSFAYFSLSIVVFVASGGCGADPSSSTEPTISTDSSTGADTAETAPPVDAPFETVGETNPEAEPGDTGVDASDDTSIDTAEDAASEAEVAEDATPETEVAVDTGPPVVCTTAAINDVSFGTSNQVRQGYGPVQLNITGTNLGAISSAMLGPLACTIVLKSATTALLSCDIAHGAPLGPHALTLSNGENSGSCSAAVNVTKITVDADGAGASDTTGLGTPSKPFRSIRRGLLVSADRDTVFVGANGTSSYSVAGTGETFVPTGTSTDPFGTFAANVPSGVTIEGDTMAPTRITGAKNDAYVVFKLAGSATLKNLQIDGFRFAIVGNSGTISISNVSIKNAGSDAFVMYGSATTTIDGTCDVGNNTRYGLLAAGMSKVTVSNCAIHHHDSNGVHVRDNATVTGTTIKVYNNSSAANGSPGIVVTDSGTLDLTSSEVQLNYQGGIFGNDNATIHLLTTKVFNNGKRVGNTTAAPVSGGTRFDGVRMVDGKALTIAGGQIYANGASGVGVYETSKSALVGSINGVNIQNNFYDGLRFDAQGSLTVRNTIFEDNVGNGVQIENTPSLLDFGTASESGGNTFRRLVPATTPGTAGAALLGDFRPARFAADGVLLTVSGSTFQTLAPMAAVRTGPHLATVAGQLLYEIANANNRIQFF